MNTSKFVRWSFGFVIALVMGSACSPTVGPGTSLCGGLTSCASSCVNTQADPLNCGSCGQACGAGLVCSSGTCSSTCEVGLQVCGNACENLQTSLTSCGQCGVACAGTCQAGVCSTSTVGSGGGSGIGTGGGSGSGGDSTVSTGGAGATTGSGGGTNVADPAGFWRYDSWKGCAWTGVDATSSGTTVQPSDFKARATGEPFCAKGEVGANADYESVALLGFNLNEDPATADCSYDEGAAQAEGPPEVTLTGSGIAANIVKQGTSTDFTFRVQIQG
jgi:hypothetical protein